MGDRKIGFWYAISQSGMDDLQIIFLSPYFSVILCVLIAAIIGTTCLFIKT